MITEMSQMAKNASKAEQLLKLLANSNRLVILCNLLHSELTVSELQHKVQLSQSALSQHLAKMRKEGLLATSKEGTHVTYRINKPEVETILSALYSIYCKG